MKKNFRKNHWKGKLLICKTCKIPKNSKEFGPDKREKHRNFKSLYCRICCNEKSYKLREKYKNNINFYFKILFHIIKNRVKYFEKYKNRKIKFTITEKDLLDLWDIQKGCCALSGLKMTYKRLEGRQNRNASVDRINNNKGYVKGNVQLVCNMVNMMKADLTKKELFFYCNKIINNGK